METEQEKNLQRSYLRDTIIDKIICNEANLEYIAKNNDGKINGTLRADIANAMEEYWQKAGNGFGLTMPIIQPPKPVEGDVRAEAIKAVSEIFEQLVFDRNNQGQKKSTCEYVADALLSKYNFTKK